jgi:predicted nucleotide-binding protein (sugar kinase/HSP70/actin superfamily)
MRPKVGIPQALTYHYRSSRIVERFLREAGAEVVRSPKTTPEIHAAATTLGSADFCLSLRMLVGHVHHLVTQHPDLDFLLVPHLCSEDGEKTTTCSKYRDAGGVALRSLTTTLDYLMQHAPQDTRQAAAAILQAAGVPRTSGDRFPVLLQPYICSLQREDMFNVCFGVYCDVFGISSAVRIAEGLVPQRLQGILAPHLRRCVAPFETAYEAVMRRDTRRLDRFLADTQAVRVGLICREYLVDEPLLTADVKAWFMKAGARVITPEDVRAEDLPPGPQAPWAFYDTHRRFDALVEFLAPHVDGFIFAGSFGCHPDAFIMDLLLDRVRRQGIPAWLFRYDEQSGSAGFQTRYETIMRLLEQRRDRRLAGGLQTPSAHPWPAANASDAADAKHASTIVTNPAEEQHRVPLLIWPYMSDHIDLIMRELLEQGGLTQYALPPKTASDVTLSLGSDTFTDSS